MDKRKVIYYTDEQNDEFSVAEITPRKIDGSYVYIREGFFRRFTHFFWYRVVALPVALIYCKGVFGQRAKGTRKLKKAEGKGSKARETVTERLTYNDIKTAKPIIKF